MTTPKRNPLKLPLALGFASVALGVILVPVILVDAPERTTAFWLRIGWTLVLVGLLWGALSGVLTSMLGWRGPRQTSQGASHATVAVIGGYVTLSFALMTLHALVHSTMLIDRIHLALQVTLAVAAVVYVVMISAATRLHDIDRTTRQAVISRDELMLRVQATQRRIEALNRPSLKPETGDLLQALRVIRDQLERSLPPRSAMEVPDRMIWLGSLVHGICKRLDEVEYEDLGRQSLRSQLISDLEVIKNEVEAIARMQRR